MNRSMLGVPVLALTIAACQGGAAESTQEVAAPVAVRAVAITEESVVRPIVATGVVGPKEEVALAFKVGGVVGHVLVDAGATVRAGQTLAVLEQAEIDAAVTRARSGAEKAERDLERARRLFTDSVVTLAQFQDAETAARVARADHESARFNRRYATITAPADGVVLRRLAEPGELVSPGVPVLMLGSRARGNVLRVGLADRDVVRVSRGDRALITLGAFPDRTLEGVVSEIAAAAQPGTGTYTVELALPAAARLVSGLVGSAEIRPAQSGTMRVIPIDALIEADGDRATVFVLNAAGTHVERRTVTIAFSDGLRVGIGSGLERAARVITDGAAYLTHGAAVKVVP